MSPAGGRSSERRRERPYNDVNPDRWRTLGYDRVCPGRRPIRIAGVWAVEARSVNGRNLDVRFRGPPGFDDSSALAREAARRRFQRGQIGVTVQGKRAEAAGAGPGQSGGRSNDTCGLASPMSPPAARRRRRWMGCSALRGVIDAGEDDDDPDAHAAIEAAMAHRSSRRWTALEASRLVEGAALAGLLSGFLDRIAALVARPRREARGPAA